MTREASVVDAGSSGWCSTCRKMVYRNFGKAAHAALSISRNGGGLRPYRCPEGPGWHLTKKRCGGWLR